MHNVSPSNYRLATSTKPAKTVHCDYVRHSHLNDYLASSASVKEVLAIISFGEEIDGISDLPCPRIKVDIPQLNNTRLVEIWRSSTPVLYNERSGIHYATDGDALFGFIHLPDSDQSTIDDLTCDAYRRIFDLLQTESYPHLVRVWNYVPDINKTTNGLERYHLFCLGRYQAFSERNRFFEHGLPAASAIGVRRGTLYIYFLAARHAGRQIENPRQVSAFHYPSCYGSRSPSFSRAILKEWNDSHHLYISGTASIVGHESCHDGNPDEQLRETLRNIESLLEHAAHVSEIRDDFLNGLSCMKIYIRHSCHFDLVKNFLEQRFSRELPAIYLQGDICRNNLLLEIEAICHGRPVAHTWK